MTKDELVAKHVADQVASIAGVTDRMWPQFRSLLSCTCREGWRSSAVKRKALRASGVRRQLEKLRKDPIAALDDHEGDAARTFMSAVQVANSAWNSTRSSRVPFFMLPSTPERGSPIVDALLTRPAIQHSIRFAGCCCATSVWSVAGSPVGGSAAGLRVAARLDRRSASSGAPSQREVSFWH